MRKVACGAFGRRCSGIANVLRRDAQLLELLLPRDLGPSAVAPAPLDHLWLSTLPAASKRWLGSNVARVMDVQGARVMDVQGAMIKLPISEAYARGVLPPPSPPVSPDDHASRVHQVL